MPASEVKNMPKEEIEMAKKELGFDPTKPVGMYSQSGLQIATGNVSLGSDFKKVAEKSKKEMGGAGGGFDLDPNTSGKKKEGGTAPLLFLYPVALLGGIILGFIPWAGMPRKIIAAGCCAAAFGVVGLQAAIGFPLENDLKKQADQMKGFGGMGKFGGGGGGAKTDTKSSSKDNEMFKVAWKFPLYLTFLLLLTAGGTAFLGPNGPGGKYKPKRKAYDLDDEDDDEDDEDDDRPRKKKRRDDDDDDDDRPRKKKAVVEEDDEDAPPPKKKAAPPPPPPPPAPAAKGGSDNPFDFDDDPPPKKKKRRDDDDDDDDDRPRKKRRRDDD